MVYAVKRFWGNAHIRRGVLVFLAAGAFVLLVIVGVVAYVSTKQNGRIYTSANDVKQHKVAIVFGARVRANGTLSPLLADRVDGGIELYKKGRVSKLLMTGDNGTKQYDEVTAMKNYAIKAGVPERDITLDYAGFDTYDSCYRARAIFGLSDAVLVTQRYHMPRALYICNSLGVSADGLAINDFDRYPNLRVSYSMREYAASIKAWLDVTVTQRMPRYLGNPEPIT